MFSEVSIKKLPGRFRTARSRTLKSPRLSDRDALERGNGAFQLFFRRSRAVRAYDGAKIIGNDECQRAYPGLSLLSLEVPLRPAGLPSLVYRLNNHATQSIDHATQSPTPSP